MKQIIMFMIQQSGAIRSFVDNIYTGKISTRWCWDGSKQSLRKYGRIS